MTGYIETEQDRYLNILERIEDILVKIIESKAFFQSSVTKKTVTLAAQIPAASTVMICPANPARRGLTVYNNSTNSLYVGVESDVSGGNQIGQCASNAGPTAHFYMMGPVVYTGALYGRRNTGSGSVVVTEFE